MLPPGLACASPGAEVCGLIGERGLLQQGERLIQGLGLELRALTEPGGIETIILTAGTAVVVYKLRDGIDQAPSRDSAASNGTVLMAKLVTGLAMLHLMHHKNKRIRTICYLDEALALDTRNQKNLIDVAAEFGFALICASPAPLTTARYCVPIHHHAGKNHINRQSWLVLAPKERP
ncbi:hypothetical protein WP8S18C01_23120 [Aeromonas caviae]|jgi:hypothetical protein|nr:hypothetical protein WP8S18C01_23120 [Aeromonas caviae]